MFAPASLICIETIFKTYLFYYPSQQGLKITLIAQMDRA